jgi:hypothetical protein
MGRDGGTGASETLPSRRRDSKKSVGQVEMAMKAIMARQ